MLARSPTAQVLIADSGRPHQQTLIGILNQNGVAAHFEHVGDSKRTASSFADWCTPTTLQTKQAFEVPSSCWPLVGCMDSCTSKANVPLSNGPHTPCALQHEPRLRLLDVEEDGRLFGLSCMPAMY